MRMPKVVTRAAHAEAQHLKKSTISDTIICFVRVCISNKNILFKVYHQVVFDISQVYMNILVDV